MSDIVSRSGWDHLYTSARLQRSAWSNQPVVGETVKLRELCAKAKPQIIVELGCRLGGTTLALHDAAPEAVLLAFDKECAIGTDKIHDFDGLNARHAGYDNAEYHTKRSWFPYQVMFARLDFVQDSATVRDIIRSLRDGTLFLFVDGDFGQKPHDAQLYVDTLQAGDVLAVNNFGDEWQLPEIEGWLMPLGFDRFEFDWCEQVGLQLTRAWVKQ